MWGYPVRFRVKLGLPFNTAKELIEHLQIPFCLLDGREMGAVFEEHRFKAGEAGLLNHWEGGFGLDRTPGGSFSPTLATLFPGSQSLLPSHPCEKCSDGPVCPPGIPAFCGLRR